MDASWRERRGMLSEVACSSLRSTRERVSKRPPRSPPQSTRLSANAAKTRPARSAQEGSASYHNVYSMLSSQVSGWVQACH